MLGLAMELLPVASGDNPLRVRVRARMSVIGLGVYTEPGCHLAVLCAGIPVRDSGLAESL